MQATLTGALADSIQADRRRHADEARRAARDAAPRRAPRLEAVRAAFRLAPGGRRAPAESRAR
jgi:hypothetical protein